MKQSSASRTATTARNLEEQIRYRAYELYENRGREDGHDVDDWLQAETEVTGKTARPCGCLNTAQRISDIPGRMAANDLL